MSETRSEELTLCIDTATAERSVAVARGSYILSLIEGDAEKSSSSELLADVDAALKKAGATLEDIDLFAAANGPGTFTGLRSGLATLKAFAMTLGRPVLGIPTLHAVAHGARPAKRLIATIPAGRGEVFAQLFSVTDQGVTIELEKIEHIKPEKLLEKAQSLGDSVKWAGSGSVMYQKMIRDAAYENGIVFAEDSGSKETNDEKVWTLDRRTGGLARSVAQLVQMPSYRTDESDPGNLKAFYARPSDAELKKDVKS